MASQDIDNNKQLYSGFMTTLKWVIPVLCVIVLFVMMLIAG